MDLDHVDSLLLQTDGLITRQRDPHFCRHGHNAMCDYCLPLEPYDANFLASQKIKYLSFHSHVRKLASAGLSKNNRESIKSQLLAGKPETGYLLEEPDYGLKECHSHAKYPLGLCSKCQPGPVTLQPQASDLNFFSPPHSHSDAYYLHAFAIELSYGRPCGIRLGNIGR